MENQENKASLRKNQILDPKVDYA